MNGLLLIFLSSFVAQAQNEVLPGPLRNSPANVSPSVMPPGPSVSQLSKVSVGYGYDTEGIYCMIIQIAPDAIADFARGDRGQELQAMIPPEIRDHVQRVIVRVGTGEVERILPRTSSFSSTRNNSSPYVASLNGNSNPTPVNIDPPRNAEVLPTSGTNNSYGNAGAATSLNLPPSPLNGMATSPGSAPNLNASNLNSPPYNPTMPNSSNLNSPNANWDRSMQNNWAGGNPNYASTDASGRFVNTNAQNSNYATGGANNGEVLPSTSLAGNDRFSPTGSSRAPSAFDNFLRPNNTAASNSGYNGYAGAYSNNNVGRNGPGALVAQNPNIGVGESQTPIFPSTSPNTNNYLGSQGYPNLGSQGYPTQNPANYAPAGMPPLSSVNGYASGMAPNVLPGYRTATNPNPTPNGSNAGNYTNTTAYPGEHSQQAVTTNRFLQYFSLFSVVANVYLMIWMVHLRTRYRELVSNMRGIPLSELS